MQHVRGQVDTARIEKAVREILEAIGEDPEREGLVRTPQRVAEMYEEIFAGLADDPAEHLAPLLWLPEDPLADHPDELDVGLVDQHESVKPPRQFLRGDRGGLDGRCVGGQLDGFVLITSGAPRLHLTIRMIERPVRPDEVGRSLKDISEGLGLRIIRDGTAYGFWRPQVAKLEDGDLIMEICPTCI